MLIAVVVCFYLCIQNAICENSGKHRRHLNDERRLISDLLAPYKGHTQSRPLVNSSQAINVTFGIGVTQIIDLSETEGILITQIWKHLEWYDHFLTFNGEDYGGINFVALSPNQIWTPDITLYNSLDRDRIDLSPDTAPVLVSSSGLVQWIPPMIYTSACQVNVETFPFDAQTCSLTFGSWVHSIAQLNLLPVNDERYQNGVDRSEYLENNEWNLTSISTIEKAIKYSCCGDQFKHVIFNLTLTRRPGFYSYVLIMPSIVLSSVLLVVYWVPSQRPDRTTLGMGICSALILQLLVIIEKTPPTAQTRIGRFCAMNIVAAGIGVLISVITVNVSTRKHRMPNSLRKFFVVWLNDALCLCPSERLANKEMPETPQSGDTYFASQGAKSQHKRSASDEWLIMALVINRIIFVVHFGILMFAVIWILPWEHNV